MKHAALRLGVVSLFLVGFSSEPVGPAGSRSIVVPAGQDGIGASNWELPSEPVRGGVLDLVVDDSVEPVLAALARDERLIDAFELVVERLAEVSRRRGLEHPETLRWLRRVGVIAMFAGDQDTAMTTLDAAIAAQRRAGGTDSTELGELLIRRGRLARHLQDLDGAQRLYDEAERRLRASAFPPAALVGELLAARADLMRVRGVSDDLRLAHYRAAVEWRQRTLVTPSYPLAESLVWYAWNLLWLRRIDEGESVLERAEAELTALAAPDNHLWATLHNLRADREALGGRWDEASRHYREVQRVLLHQRREMPCGFSRSMAPLDGGRELALAALLRGDGETAWRLTEESRAETTVELTMLRRWAQLEPQSHAEQRTLRRSLLEVRRRVDRRLAQGDTLWSRNAAPDLLAMVRLTAQLQRAGQRYLLRHPVGIPSSEEVRRRLPAGTAMVGWLSIELGGRPNMQTPATHMEEWAYVLRADRPLQWVTLFRSGVTDPAALRAGSNRLASQKLAEANQWPTAISDDPRLRAAYHQLSELRFHPLLPHLDGVSSLIVSGMMLPLVVELFTTPGGDYAVETFDISYVPSASTYALLRDDPAPQLPGSWRSILAVAGPSSAVRKELDGDALGAAPPLRRSTTDLRGRSRRTLPDLEFVQPETLAAARSFPLSRVILADQTAAAQLERLASDNQLQQFDVIHIATHALSSPIAERGAMVLNRPSAVDSEPSDGLLEVRDVLLGWELDAELCTLSGCETGSTGGIKRLDHIGFTSALFAVGARRVLPSLWPVDDRATALLMRRFYQNLAAARLAEVNHPPDVASALAAAKRWLRQLQNPTGRRPYAHPTYWAGFLLIGGP